MPPSAKWDAIYPKLSDRFLSEGCIDASFLADSDFSSLSKADFRDAAIDAADYLLRILQDGTRKVSFEEYYLVMQLALCLGIACSLSSQALTEAERSRVEKQLVEMLKPKQTQSLVRNDLLSGRYASLSGVWPFLVLSKEFVHKPGS
jgi:hypothetical protein